MAQRPECVVRIKISSTPRAFRVVFVSKKPFLVGLKQNVVNGCRTISLPASSPLASLSQYLSVSLGTKQPHVWLWYLFVSFSRSRFEAAVETYLFAVQPGIDPHAVQCARATSPGKIRQVTMLDVGKTMHTQYVPADGSVRVPFQAAETSLRRSAVAGGSSPDTLLHRSFCVVTVAVVACKPTS